MNCANSFLTSAASASSTLVAASAGTANTQSSTVQHQRSASTFRKKMLDEARRKFPSPAIRFLRMPIEDYDYPPEQFDAVLSSLAFHYIESFDDICRKVARTLLPGGSFVFSAEHPVFTAEGSQQWIRGDAGEPLHWPVDNYYIEGKRSAVFLGEPVAKYHRTLTAYVNGLLRPALKSQGWSNRSPKRRCSTPCRACATNCAAR